MTNNNPAVKGEATRKVFPIYDESANLLSGATGLDSEYSLDGGSFADCSNEAIEIDSTGWYYIDLISAETNGDVVAIQTKTTSATGKTACLSFETSAQTFDDITNVVDDINSDVQVIQVTTHYIFGKGGTVLDDVANSALTFKVHMHTPRPGTLTDADDFYNDMQILFIGGVNESQSRRISDWVLSTKFITVDTAFDSEPTLGDEFVIISGWTPAVATEAKQDAMQIDIDLIEALSKNKRVLDVANSQWLLYDIAGTSVILTWPALDKNGNPVTVADGVPTQIGVPY